MVVGRVFFFIVLRESGRRAIKRVELFSHFFLFFLFRLVKLSFSLSFIHALCALARAL